MREVLMSSGIELIGSLKHDRGMARPRNFSRETVLEKALPVFWKHGFADASLQELEKARDDQAHNPPWWLTASRPAP